MHEFPSWYLPIPTIPSPIFAPIPHLQIFLLSSRLRNSSLQRLRVRAHDLSLLLPVLEDDECGHGADTEFLCNVWHLVDVDLDEVDAGELGRESFVGC